MKTKIILVFLIASISFISCSRDEPAIVQVEVKPTIIKMNEIYSRGTTTDPDWIEIYNASDFEVDISGYKIYDSGGQTAVKPKLEFPAGTKIKSKGFYVIVTDIPTTTNPAGFGLSSAGEEVWLEDNKGTVIDNVVFLAMSETQSYSRIPDGGAWALTNTITKGSSNK
ncbi:MAG: lamin tail domain-containing protein [Melioribacteraceae bacterium]|nr:lamin tail domain-containing protein [Melioribacteraceae bacterium]